MAESFKIGDTTSSGYKIDHIHGLVGNEIVFRDTSGRTRWETNCESETYSKSVTKFNYLHGKIPSDLPEKIEASIKSELAASLHHAFIGNNIEGVNTSFEVVENRILSILSPNQAKLWLILYCLISSVTLLLVLFGVHQFIKPSLQAITLCAGAGVLGGTLSLMQRNTHISINLEDGKPYIFMQAAFIPILGMLSGICLCFLSRSDLAFSFAKDNIYNLITLSVISGFSERYVPDLFQKIGKETLTPSRKEEKK